MCVCGGGGGGGGGREVLVILDRGLTCIGTPEYQMMAT